MFDLNQRNRKFTSRIPQMGDSLGCERLLGCITETKVEQVQVWWTHFIQGSHMKMLTILVSTVGLVACGGGGGSDTDSVGSAVSTLSFPYGAADRAEASVGSTATLTAVGTSATEATDGLCSGTRTYYSGVPTGGATFEGIPALAVASTTQTSWTNCTPSSSISSGTSYYDSNYSYLGSINQSGSYTVRASNFITPEYVKVGDVIIRGTHNFYTNSSKTTSAGHRDVSLVVEPDTANTAIVNSISKYYNANIVSNGVIMSDGKLNLVSQYRSRISSSGALTLISVDLQYYNTTSTKQMHLVFRR